MILWRSGGKGKLVKVENFVKLWQIHEFCTIFSCFTYICPKLAQILKYFALLCDCMIVAFRNSGTALHHIILYCTTEYGTAMYCTTLNFTVAHYITLERISLHCTLLSCSAYHCTALHCTMLHFVARLCFWEPGDTEQQPDRSNYTQNCCLPSSGISSL